MKILQITLIFILSLGGCSASVPRGTDPLKPTRFEGAALSSQRGPWNADSIRTAESILRTAPVTDLDKQRQSLAHAYLDWGDALLKGFGLTPSETTPSAPQNDQQAQPIIPSGNATPPLWYWTDRQQLQRDQMLQQQKDLYYRERQPPPQFQRPPMCNSYSVGGQVYTQCN